MTELECTPGVRVKLVNSYLRGKPDHRGGVIALRHRGFLDGDVLKYDGPPFVIDAVGECMVEMFDGGVFFAKPANLTEREE